MLYDERTIFEEKFIDRLEPAGIITTESLTRNASVGRELTSGFAERPCEAGGCDIFSAQLGVSRDVRSISSIPVQEYIKTIIKVLHLVGIIMGLGSATVLDLLVVRFCLPRSISTDYIELIEFIAVIVVVGLAVIWVSGIMYLIYYVSYDPIKLGNEKIWAKISIVMILTVNGFFVHKIVLPTVRHQVGASLFQGIAYERRSMLLMFGAISAVSWYVPLSLGAAAFLNFVVPASVILSMYAVLLAIAVAVTRATAFSIWERWIPESGGSSLVRAELGVPRRLQGA